MCYRSPGIAFRLALDWGRGGAGRGAVNTTGDVYTEIHSLFTQEPQSSLSGVWIHAWSGPALGSGQAGLGCAAAGAGCALRAADAVGRTAVLRGWWGGGDLLPSCSLPCS